MSTLRSTADAATGLKAIIAIHNTQSWSMPWADVGCGRILTAVKHSPMYCDLSKGMTYKAAMANLQQGGGKAVIIGDPRKYKSPDFMQAMGRFVESLSGQYITAEDSGITVDDLKAVATQTRTCGRYVCTVQRAGRNTNWQSLHRQRPTVYL